VIGLAVLALMSITNAGGQNAMVQQELSTNRQTVTEQFVTTTRFSASVGTGGYSHPNGISCLVRGFLLRATQGLNVSGSFSYNSPLDIYVIPDSAFKGHNATNPCSYSGAEVLLAEKGIRSSSFTLIFPRAGLYWFTFIDQGQIGTSPLSFELEAFPSVIITLAATPTSQTTFLASATSSIATTYPLATGAPSVPFGSFGLVGIIAGVAVISSILFVMKKRKNTGLESETLGPRTEIVRSPQVLDEKPFRTSSVPFAAMKQETTDESVSMNEVPKQTQVNKISPIEGRKESVSVLQPATAAIIPDQKPATPSKISTGYGELDSMMQGGIPEGYAIVLVSRSFDERDLLVNRTIASSLASGRPTFYLSTDIAKTRDLVSKFRQNFYALNPFADEIAADRDNLFKIPDVGDLSNLNITSNEIMESKAKNESGKMIVIDLLSDLLVRNKASMTRRWLTNFAARRKASGFTILATLDPSTATQEEIQMIIGVFDGIIEVYEKPLQERSRRFLVIKKLYGRDYSEGELMLDKHKLL